VVVVAGVYYITNTRAVDALAGVEPDKNNQLRRRLRQINGGAMVVLGLAFFWVYYETEVGKNKWRFLVSMLLLTSSLLSSVFLVMIDVWLTARLRHRNRPPGSS
jgi:hypothetical protein